MHAFLGFAGSALVIVALTGRLSAVSSMPEEFAPLRALVDRLNPSPAEASPDFALEFCAGVAVGIIALAAITILRLRYRARKLPVLGDIEPLMPRNLAEGFWTAVLSINAGVTEEILFRLVVPSTAWHRHGQRGGVFVIAIIAFGAMHLTRARPASWGRC